jgi:NAD+ synthetase
MIIDETQTMTLRTNYEEMYNNIQTSLNNYLVTGQLQSLVLGVSGGIDSALATALAKPVCDKLKIPLIGASISIESNTPAEEVRAEKIMKHFCTTAIKEDFTALYMNIKFKFGTYAGDMSETETQRKIRHGNIKARMRMIYLYNLAQARKGLVLSTDNYTEYLLGFWTLHGDVGDYGMFQNLWKTEIYGLSQWIVNNRLETPGSKAALQACIDAVPTDGLGITSSDLDQIGCKTYTEVDQHLLSLFFDYKKPEDRSEECSKVYERFERSGFKRKNPFNLERSRIIG